MSTSIRVSLVLGLAVIIGSGLFAFASEYKSFGYVTLLGIPIYIGFLIGYFAIWRQAANVFAVLFVLVNIALLFVLRSAAGIFCSSIACLIATLPMLTGVSLGQWYRAKHDARERRSAAILGILLIPLGAGIWLEPRVTPAHAEETVTTELELPLTVDETWDAVTLGQLTPIGPPFLHAFGLPYPVERVGTHHGVDAATRVVYTKGHLETRVTEFEPARHLAFTITDQASIENRSARLIGGSFDLEPLPGGGTRVTLSGTYEPLLDARVLWRPFERMAIRDLQSLVLRGISSRDVPEAPWWEPLAHAAP